IKRLRKTHPLLCGSIEQAHRNREVRLSRYYSGRRMKGLEELAKHLRELHEAYIKSRRLRPIAFLLVRANGDFETALEATLSGFYSTAFDAMRDVMEIEFLLREFYFEPENIQEWLTCSEKERFNLFRPAVLRQ